MQEFKRLAAGFRITGEGMKSALGRYTYQEGLPALAAAACSNGADAVWVFDGSQDDESHEAAVLAVKEAARTVDAPIVAGGYVKRLEDVKKYLYAGAAAVYLDGSSPENVDLVKEAASRFGHEKIYAWLPDPESLNRAEELSQLGASRMLLGPAAGGTGLSQRFFFMDVFQGDVRETARNLAACLALPQAEGVILEAAPERLFGWMELKQALLKENIPADTFRSPLEWEDFKAGPGGLVPVVVQDYRTLEVLMLAYMNREAFYATLETGRMTYFSRSRQRLWVKGETSGNFQYVKALSVDCDRDTLLARVHPAGPACHTGNNTCFFTGLVKKEYRETNPLKVFEEVYGVILDRREHPKEGSYTNYLFDKGLDKILKKLGEEATEIVIAAKNPNSEEVKYEISDFLYHMMVLMAQKGITWEEITAELADR